MSLARMCDRLGAPPAVRAAAERAAAKTQNVRYEPQRAVAGEVLNAFFEQGIADSDLTGTLGYGYDDTARATYEALLARIFGTERALARLSIVSGTHAIVATLAACASSGDGILAVTGRPYDTLRNSICDDAQSLVARGRHYREVELRDDGTIDVKSIVRALEERKYAVAFVQRSRGYAPRRSVSVDECARAVEAVKRVSPATFVLVDNCYGELVEEREPTHVGADAVMGSLIKNLGGSIAPGGGYVAGSAAVIERVATRIYVPGLGDSLGPTLGFGRAFVHGLFLAPSIVEQCLRGLDFAAALFEELGYSVDPKPGERRTDIVQAIRLGSSDLLMRFAAGLQAAMPLNARFRPEPGPVPGYGDPVVMSGGAFVAGATIELSCDAPLRPPYDVYLQGGTSADHVRFGALSAATFLAEKTGL
jgi:cystathionine beta-lyase family protein involved in aluminum resistance